MFFQTLSGSVVILFAMLGIIFVVALLATALLRGIFLTDVEAAGTTTVSEPSTEHGFRQAAYFRSKVSIPDGPTMSTAR